MAGNDTIKGNNGNDHLYGGDKVHSTLDGADNVYGRAGDDYVEGGVGDDTLNGGIGNDIIVEGPDEDQALDTIYGDDGDDEISAAGVPDSRDEIDCGEGIDYVQADALDAVSSNCEKVEIFDPDAAPPDTTPVPEGDYKRNCTVNRFGFKKCGVDFRVYRQDVKVLLRDSQNNRRIDFRLWRHLNETFDDRVGNQVNLYPGQQGNLWRNSSGNTYGAYIEAASPSPYRSWVQATVKTRSY